MPCEQETLVFVRKWPRSQEVPESAGNCGRALKTCWKVQHGSGREHADACKLANLAAGNLAAGPIGGKVAGGRPPEPGKRGLELDGQKGVKGPIKFGLNLDYFTLRRKISKKA